MWKKNILKKCELTSHINEQLKSCSNEAKVSSKDEKKPKEVKTISVNKQLMPLSNDAKVSLKDEKKSKEVKKIHVHQYVCGICKKIFSLCNSFADHLETHIIDTSDECSICTKKFQRKKDYYKHLILHAKKLAQPCKICSKTYVTWLQLRSHLNWYDTQFFCHLCDNTTFLNKEHLNKHLLLHTVEEYRTCKICDNLGSENSCVQIAVLPKQPHTCSTCGKVFSKKGSLSLHQRMHRFPCQFCFKEFSLRADLICHIRCDHPEILFQTELTSHLSGSNPESSSHNNLTSYLNVSPHEGSNNGFTSHWTTPHARNSNKTDLIKNVKVLKD